MESLHPDHAMTIPDQHLGLVMVPEHADGRLYCRLGRATLEMGASSHLSLWAEDFLGAES